MMYVSFSDPTSLKQSKADERGLPSAVNLSIIDAFHGTVITLFLCFNSLVLFCMEMVK